MATYTHEYSRLPKELFTPHHFKDVDDEIAPLVNQIKTLQMQGNYSKINTIVAQRPDLQPYIFGAENWNALEEETRNLEILAKSKKQQIFYQSEEPDGGDCNVWIA